MKIYKKCILQHPEFYIAKFTKYEGNPYIIFIHGGPGLNSGVIEYLIDNNTLFNSLSCNIILYDQRNCGRSARSEKSTLHQDNCHDLHTIISYLTTSHQLKIAALMGHSYGAKLLFDYYKKYHCKIPGIFISTADSLLIPRLNNLMMDLSFLKETNPDVYTSTMQKTALFDLEQIWKISEELDPLFQKNKKRPYLYWSNMKWYKIVSAIQKKINVPLNRKIFESIRKELYSNESNLSVDIDKLDINKIWINGFHDFIMDGSKTAVSNPKNIIPFFYSGHYPHIEENERFNEIVNEFIDL